MWIYSFLFSTMRNVTKLSTVYLYVINRSVRLTDTYVIRITELCLQLFPDKMKMK